MEGNLQLHDQRQAEDNLETVTTKGYSHIRYALDAAVAALGESMLTLLARSQDELPGHVADRYVRELHDAVRLVRMFSEHKSALHREIAGDRGPGTGSRTRELGVGALNALLKRLRKRMMDNKGRRGSRRRSSRYTSAAGRRRGRSLRRKFAFRRRFTRVA